MLRTRKVLLPVVAAALLALPAAAHAAPAVKDVSIVSAGKRTVAVTVSGTWDRQLLRSASPQRGTIGLRLRRNGKPVVTRLGWATELHRGSPHRFKHRFRLTAEQARGLRRTRAHHRGRPAQASAATLTPVVSHLVDGNGDGGYEAGTTSVDSCEQTGQGVDLSNCDLEGVYWPGVDLNSATLENTNLTGATLTQANLSFAIAPFTILAGADLTVGDARRRVVHRRRGAGCEPHQRRGPQSHRHALGLRGRDPHRRTAGRQHLHRQRLGQRAQPDRVTLSIDLGPLPRSLS